MKAFLYVEGWKIPKWIISDLWAWELWNFTHWLYFLLTLRKWKNNDERSKIGWIIPKNGVKSWLHNGMGCKLINGLLTIKLKWSIGKCQILRNTPKNI